MSKIETVTVWWYAHHPEHTEVNFHRQTGNLHSYHRVTPSSRKRLGNVLFNCRPSVGIAADYTSMFYNIKDQS